MSLDPKWTSLTGPFKDNETGAIHAVTLRQFAVDVGSQVVGGGAGVVFRGAYSPGSTYDANDVVTSAGSSYVLASGPSSGVAPPGGQWLLLAAAGLNGADGAPGVDGVDGTNGTNGADGAGFAWQGAYSGVTVYHPNDIVSFSGSSYILTGTSTLSGTAPPTSPWALLAAKGDTATVTFGTTAGTAAEGNDARLSNQRTPTDGSVTTAKIAGGGIAASAITGTAVITTDGRLSDQRTPLDNSVSTAKLIANAVTNAKLATMPTKTIKGNAGGSTATPSDLDATTVSAILQGILAAIQVAVDTSAGLQPTVQESLQAAWDAANATLTFK